ncbi:MAG: TIGR00645 family protein [Roseococcus sp.]|nr:TIGR00645 family protein [Roseococcus sp.]
MQTLLDRAMIASRYILAVFYLGLAVALAAYAVKFGFKVWKFATTILTEQDDNQILLSILYLVDSALVASLVAMVAISSYDSLVSRLINEQGKAEIEWVSNLDPGNLKLKVALAIIAISSIHLLQKFMNVDSLDDRTLIWGVVIHMAFVFGALVLAFIDRMQAQAKVIAKSKAKDA